MDDTRMITLVARAVRHWRPNDGKRSRTWLEGRLVMAGILLRRVASVGGKKNFHEKDRASTMPVAEKRQLPKAFEAELPGKPATRG
jgi:hypothetical protein